MKRDKDYEILGFHSFDAWLLNAAPVSRRYIYLAIELYQKLIPDISEEELAEMPIGSAQVFRGVSRNVRQDPKAKAAAKKGKRELRKALAKDFPEQHIETCATLHLSQSLCDSLDDGMEAYCALKGETFNMEQFLEFLLENWFQEPCAPDSPYSNRERAQQLQSVQ